MRAFISAAAFIDAAIHSTTQSDMENKVEDFPLSQHMRLHRTICGKPIGTRSLSPRSKARVSRYAPAFGPSIMHNPDGRYCSGEFPLTGGQVTLPAPQSVLEAASTDGMAMWSPRRGDARDECDSSSAIFHRRSVQATTTARQHDEIPIGISVGMMTLNAG